MMYNLCVCVCMCVCMYVCMYVQHLRQASTKLISARRNRGLGSVLPSITLIQNTHTHTHTHTPQYINTGWNREVQRVCVRYVWNAWRMHVTRTALMRRVFGVGLCMSRWKRYTRLRVSAKRMVCYVCVCVCMCVCVCEHMCFVSLSLLSVTYTHTHTHVYKHIYAHTHTHAHTLNTHTHTHITYTHIQLTHAKQFSAHWQRHRVIHTLQAHVTHTLTLTRTHRRHTLLRKFMCVWRRIFTNVRTERMIQKQGKFRYVYECVYDV